jgi:hypothetical protein
MADRNSLYPQVRARQGLGIAPNTAGPRNRLLTLALIAAVCLTQAGWLGMLMGGVVWLLGAA